ncbi:MAG: hypothetical protein M3077_11410 [Candidatus Dormibacteraeota bacterium]|nr:hypothetical protein [Candidatus Dormibacteraeota bacterium]
MHPYFPVAFRTLFPLVALVQTGLLLVAVAQRSPFVVAEFIGLLGGWLWVAWVLSSSVWRLDLGQTELEIRRYGRRTQHVPWTEIVEIRCVPEPPRNVLSVALVRRGGARTRFKVTRAHGDITALQRELDSHVAQNAP